MIDNINDYPGTSIVILSYNNLNYTKQCIESIRKYTSNENYEIIVIDNNSNEETTNWLKLQYDIKLQLNTTNNGFPGGCNDGIKFANPMNDILLLNNDIVVTKNWLTNLKIALYSNDNIGAVSPVTNSSSYWQSIPVNYNTLDEMQNFASQINISNKTRWEERVMVVGYCMLIKRSVLNKVGLLDEDYFPGNFEDDDYCFRIILSGYKVLLCRDTFVHHYGSASFNKNSSYANIMETNKVKFESKWDINITDVHFNLSYLSLVPEKENLKVLDVYGNCGVNGLMLKFYRKNLDFYIGNSSSGSYKIASKLHKTFSLEDNLGDGFDYILINNGDKFLTDINAKNLVLKALKASKNLALFISSTLYTDPNAENAKNLSLFHDYMTMNNFIITRKFSHGDSVVNFYMKC
ncbi:glycosyltransferase family 2 protein [Clostridium saudiense]|uniref:glycosyltransferase family 2 protein n=1 Tax=Clostridium saudiense TaxID=1414720 RepID=UPI0018ABD94C|nr:glycosyltransferase family 2 protein [Clostridium saudiense]